MDAPKTLAPSLGWFDALVTAEARADAEIHPTFDRSTNMSTATTSLERFQPTPRAARAHAIKNCLSAITMTCTLIERKGAVTSPKLWNCLRSASLRLLDLVVGLLGDEVDSLIATSLRGQGWSTVDGLIAMVTERLWARAESAEVSLAITCGGGELRCDQESLTEALVNLTANAIEATAPGGTVSVQTRETADRDQVWIVKDAGCGFCDAQQVAAGLRPRSTKTEGWGLGVMLAQVAVAQQGGIMKITTAPGEGTTVTVWLPREARAPVEPTSAG